MSYDFSQLSSLDFEDLCRDLLQKEEGVRYETFKPGKDQGIDARHLNGKHKTVVQSKHYLKSGFDKLISKLQNEELDKINKLSPSRYIIMTSVPLSAHNKGTIKRILSPHIKEFSDIFGQEDINNLLNRHPDIERQHFKLWLSSKAVLDRVINNAIIAQSEQLIDRMQRKIRIFVENESYAHALKILNDHRFVIISGEPGVGKTTLAEMLILHYTYKEYQPIEVRDPRDAYQMYTREKKIVYYYDDFLGLTYLGDKFSHDTARDIVNLLELVRNSKNARMILTSREYILQQAIQSFERFSNPGFINSKYQLKLASYTNFSKAKILYNHLYFSDLNIEYIEELILQNTHKKIIRHRNYTPRLIDSLTTALALKNIEKENYPSHFIKTLDNPEDLWKYPFNTQISHAGRNLLLTLLTLGAKTQSRTLEKAFQGFHKSYCREYNISQSYDDFNKASEELLGSFLKIEKEAISFHNPSIKDFLEDFIVREHEICSALIYYSHYLKQAQSIWQLLKASPLRLEDDYIENIIQASVRLSSKPPYSRMKVKNAVFTVTIDISIPDRVRFYLELESRKHNVALCSAIYEALGNVNDEYGTLVDLTDWLSLTIDIDETQKKIEPNLFNEIMEKLDKIVINQLEEVYLIEDFRLLRSIIDKGILPSLNLTVGIDLFNECINRNTFSEDIRNESSASELQSIAEDLKGLSTFFMSDVSDITLSIEAILEEMEMNEGSYDEDMSTDYKERMYEYKDEEKAIDNMFQNIDDR